MNENRFPLHRPKPQKVSKLKPHVVIFHYSYKKLKAFDKIDSIQNVPGEPELLFMQERLQDVFHKFPIKKKGHFKNLCKLAQFIKDSFDAFPKRAP